MVTAAERDQSVQLSVVVATYGRADLLPRLVRSLEAQVDAPPFDVVVVDDCSPDETRAVLGRLAGRTTLRLQVLRQPRNRGPAAARNAGWRATQAPAIVFTDDDCEPDSHWLHAMALGLREADIVQGRTIPAPDQASRRGPFSRTLDVPAMDGFFQTCNVAYQRDWLEGVGGFDEDFRHPMGEDTELAWRALDKGARAVFRSDAVVQHDIRPSSVLVQIRDSRRWESVALVVRKHPALRTKLHSKHFWRASHPPALLAGVGLGTAALPIDPRLRAAALLLLAPYLKHRLRDAPLPGAGPKRRIALLPASLAVDLSEVAVLAAASVRYRRLVL